MNPLEPGVAIYVALGVALAVWICVFVYLWRIGGRIRQLQRKLEDLPLLPPSPLPSATLQANMPSLTGGNDPVSPAQEV